MTRDTVTPQTYQRDNTNHVSVLGWQRLSASERQLQNFPCKLVRNLLRHLLPNLLRGTCSRTSSRTCSGTFSGTWNFLWNLLRNLLTPELVPEELAPEPACSGTCCGLRPLSLMFGEKKHVCTACIHIYICKLFMQ